MDKKKIENSILTLKTLYVKANVTKRKIKMPDIVCDKLSDLYSLDDKALTSAIKQKADKDKENSSRILHLKSYIVNDILMIPLSNVNSLDLLYGNQHKTINTEVEDTTDDIDDEEVDDDIDSCMNGTLQSECKKNAIVATRSSNYRMLIYDRSINKSVKYIKSNECSESLENCNIYYSKDLEEYFFKTRIGARFQFISFNTGKNIKKYASEKGFDNVDELMLHPVRLV